MQKMFLKFSFILSLVLGITLTAYTQNIGINNPSPDASAILDLTSTTQGFLIPRMTSIQRNLIPAPATGLIVYDITLARFMFYNGLSWNGLLSNFIGWDVLGNTGTNAATNFLGTIDGADLVFRTVNVEHMRINQTGDVGINTPVINAKAAFQITSINKGVLLPRMSTAQRLSLIANGSSLDATRDGMLLYDTNLKNFMSWNSLSLQWDTIVSRSNGSGLYWQLLGNTATDTAVNYLGTTDSTDLIFRTNGRERFRIRANGLFYTSNQGSGASNIYMGGLSGSLTTTGSNNAGYGLGALQNNTTGSGNSALGSYALLNNTSGYDNTGVGIESLRNNTTGYGNTAVGERSGYNNTTAYGNTSIGRYAIYNNLNGLENVGVGDSVLFGSTTNVGSYNVAVGNRVLFNNTGLRNVGIGYLSLYDNTSGGNNVGIGSFALTNNISGSSNVGIGTYALYDHTQGTYNIGIGYYAGKGITTGDYNTALGPYTLFSARNNGALNNVAIGYYALYTDTLPTSNVSIGMYSMANGTLRDQNVAIGYFAMRGNGATIGLLRNVAIGSYSGFSISTGDDNVFIGTNSGRTNTSASNNVFIGTDAGYDNTTGDLNVYIGNSSGANSTNADQNVYIGDHAGFDNTTGYYNSFVGFESGRSNNIGTQNSFYGWWSGYNHTSGVANTYLGSLTGFGSTTGGGNTAVGAAAGNAITTGSQNTFVGWIANANANRTNSAAYGFGALVNASNKIRLGNAAVTVIEGQPLNYTGISDGRFKKNLTEDVHGLDFILKLRPVSYNFDKVTYDEFLHKHDKDYKPTVEYLNILEDQGKIRQAGFIAQEMEEARLSSGFNSFDAVAKPEDEDGTWGIAYGTLVVPLVKSVQELNEKNKALQAQNDELKKLLENLKVRIEDLEQNMKK